ncbi:unnamed protein product [Protopolystoma xenopodis]|uniref:Uncharacterized protein n=1 Tax=Protopolystoma xenopodis TaxID=117903 RepID=A0A3S5APJ1_9PLAT|nr:unnamed protein product [Protopolystoma xenopodis]
MQAFVQTIKQAKLAYSESCPLLDARCSSVSLRFSCSVRLTSHVSVHPADVIPFEKRLQHKISALLLSGKDAFTGGTFFWDGSHNGISWSNKCSVRVHRLTPTGSTEDIQGTFSFSSSTLASSTFQPILALSYRLSPHPKKLFHWPAGLPGYKLTRIHTGMQYKLIWDEGADKRFRKLVVWLLSKLASQTSALPCTLIHSGHWSTSPCSAVSLQKVESKGVREIPRQDTSDRHALRALQQNGRL